MFHRRSLVVANWKMNGSMGTIGSLLDDILAGLQQYDQADVVICPPFVYLAELVRSLGGSGIALGAQDVCQYQAGAYTGEVAAEMLQDFQCQYVIVGHSERRRLFAETDVLVAEKCVRAQAAGLVPIFCVGESLAERESGSTEMVIARQLDALIVIAGIATCADVVIAYEPVWAIGTGKTATPEQAQEVHAFIRLQLARHNEAVAAKIRLLYGGSVKATNAEELFKMADIDGGLIGGASLSAGEFLSICHLVR